MISNAGPVLRDIVLIGGGHSHVAVLKSFAMKPLPGTRLTLICRDTHTPYSGMLPGYVAGHYAYDEVHIDLDRLAEFAGARFYRDEAVGIDRTTARVLCRNRPPVPYDRLSINIGATPQLAHVAGAAALAMAVKPIFEFNQRWLSLLARVREHTGPISVAVVGAGAGGVELTLAMQFRLHRELQQLGRDPDAVQFHLFEEDAEILPTHNAYVRRCFERVLRERGVQVHRRAEVRTVLAGAVVTADGMSVQADEVVWATQASGAPWLRNTGLALDADGFVLVSEHLQSLTDAAIFAAGDVASMEQHLEKAGVFAVRQGKPLAENLRRSLLGAPLRRYSPQRNWLALISTGDRHAVASRGALGWRGDWVWRWKDWIDRRFMRRYSELAMTRATTGAEVSALPLSDVETAQAVSALEMRCGGCGAKVGAGVLLPALGALQPLPRDDVLIGLRAPDDAAVVRVPSGKAMVHSVDFFRSFINDPYIFGKVAANHALSDIFAMGAEAQTATAIVTLPPGLESKLRDDLAQMMTGALEVLNEAGCTLVGGHTGEGSELALGFAVNGLIDENLSALTRKSGMQAGDMLILTKPLGSGMLLAAHARLQARGRWIDAALVCMMQSSRLAAQCLREHGVSACTDVTGFGLLGHLLEMTRASKALAELDLAALPLLEGAVQMATLGIRSSLHRANEQAWATEEQGENHRMHTNYPLLFDPQTAGGLLASVPAQSVAACLLALHAQGYREACVIGRVTATGAAQGSITLRA